MGGENARIGGSDGDSLPSRMTESADSSPSAGDVTLILASIEQGQPQASEQLLPLVYDELRKLATARMAQEKPGQTLQATALVHEAYLRLVDTKKVQHWDSRGHFFAAAAEAMRRIVIEAARHKQRVKRGGRVKRFALDNGMAASMSIDDLLDLDEALSELEVESKAKADLVKLRFYAGMTAPEAAEALGISKATADRYWTYARCWLYGALFAPDTSGDGPEKSARP